MSSVVPLRRSTPGEDALIAKAEAGLAPADEARREALDALRSEGLPSRRVEAWHYTDLRALVGRAGGTGDAASGDDDLLAPLLPGSIVVQIGGPAPAGLLVTAGGEVPDWHRVVNHLDRKLDTIRLLSAAFGARATTIVVPANAAGDHPIELRGEATGSGERAYAICEVGAGAKATIVERLSAGAAGSLSTAVNRLVIGSGADVLWIVDQERGLGETHLGQLSVEVGADARFRLFVMNAGGAVVRQEVHVVTAGEGAEISMRGINLIDGERHIDVTTTLNHTVPNTNATEIFRNIVMGGRGVFQGMIKVARGAQKTDARMACNTLLLSDEGDFSAKPELEIFADDVQCGHGATAGEIDANHLFYLMSRGIPAPQAKALLIKAFLAEVIEELEDDAVVEALEARLDAWLEARAG